MIQQSLLPAWLLKANPDAHKHYLDAINAMDEKALSRIFRGAKLCDLPAREDMKKLKMPSLILAWVDDPTHPLDSAEAIGALLPASQLVVAKDVCEQKTWAQKIRDFVMDLS